MTASGDAESLFDFDRERRIGLHEAVFAEGKNPAQLASIVDENSKRGLPLLLTRLHPAAYAELPESTRTVLDFDESSRTAILGAMSVNEHPQVAIVTAGTVDLPPAREAVRTLAFHGQSSRLFTDIGVAGLWRLLERKDEIARFPVVIALAGMEGALFTVLGGLIPGLMIAVPTSNGYGVAEHGRLALEAALSSCAPGVVVCNIDNGYGAACAALRVLRLAPSAADITAPSDDG